MIKLLSKYKFIVILILLSVTGLFFAKESSSKETLSILKESTIEQSKEEDFGVDRGKATSKINEVTTPALQSETLIPIYICGAVVKPGVYYVNETAILEDLLKQAGGLLEESDLGQINLAQAVHANEKIYIPKVGEEIDKMVNSYENEERANASTLINMNRASAVELMTLPGVGEIKAEQIVQYREQAGFFRTKEEIMNVPGIGEKTYEGLQAFITVE